MKSLAISDRKDSLSSCPALAQTTMGTPHNHYYRWRRKQRNLQRLSSLPPSRIMSLSTKTLVALLFVTCSMTSCVSGFSVVSNNKAHTYQTLQPQTSIRSSYLSVVHVNRPSVRGSRLCLSSSTNDDESSSSSDEEEWQAVLAAFKMYKAAYGNLKVPLRFVVPALPPWPGSLFTPKTIHALLFAIVVSGLDFSPQLVLVFFPFNIVIVEKAWNLKLGQRVAAIRTTGKYVHDEKRRKILDDMGFVWRIRATKSSTKDKDVSGISFDQIYSALATYKEQIQKGSGPLSVPPSFVVPDCEPWPENTRGLPLGKKLSTIRSKAFLASNPGAKEKLKAIGLQLDGKVAANDARFQMVYDALKRYKEIYGDLLVPQPFVVPENSQEWPENTWGLRLGARVNAIRSQGTFVSANPERKELLNDLGFVWSLPKSESGNRRGRRRKEEIEAMEARAASAEGSGGNNENKSEADTSAVDTSLDSLFGGNFEFAQDDFPIFGGDGGPDSPTWTVEGGSRLDEAARRAEEEAQAAEEYTPPRNLADSLAEAKQRAIDVGVIEKDR